MRNNALVARCKNVQGKWVETSLQDFQKCKGDIQNVFGQLACLSQTLEDQPVEAPPAGWQLMHDTWTFKDGAPGSVMAVAQTTDGFLWLGGPSGLFRFDGRQFELFHSPFGEELLSTNIFSLFAPTSGGLWIGYTFGGASFLDKGRMKNYGGDFAAHSGTINGMAQDKDGVLWAATGSGLWRFDDSHWQHVGMEWNVPIKDAADIWLDRDANLCVQGEGKFLCLPRGSRQFQQSVTPSPSHFKTTRRLVDQEGSVWFVSLKGLDRFFSSPLVKQELPGGGGFFGLAADHDGMVWVGGLGPPLYRVVDGKTQVLPKYPSWVIGFMYRAPDSTVWIGASSGLWHETLSQRRPSRNPKESKLWFDVRQTLWRFTGRDWDFVELPPEVADQGLYLQAITQDRAGGMWVSLGRHGLYRLADGVWTRYSGRSDLPNTGVVCEFTDSLGRVWFGYLKNQLAVLDGDRVQVFGPADGIDVGNITAIHGRGRGIWIGGEFGLLALDAGHFKSISAVRHEWLRGISGIVETANGDLWLNGISGIFHVPHSELAQALKNPSYQVKGEHFGRRDGLTGSATQIRPLPSAIEASDGRIWFATTAGVVSLDPTHAEKNSPSSPIAIQLVSADGKTYDRTFPLKFPARASSVQIDYSAVSLSDPEAIRFRYKLEETDQDWHEAATASPVTFRNLPPGLYHFRVDATDTNGVWSDKVAIAEFTILPAFYQTAWFRVFCLGAFLALLWALYQLRLRQLARQFHVRLEERVNERTRIARELHDTLLQNLHGLLFRFQAARNMLPRRTEEAMEAFDGAIMRTEQAIAESRDTIKDLRSERVPSTDLAELLTQAARELETAADANGNPPIFRVIVEGERQTLSPALQDEVYRIARELLRNALQHAGAHHIEAETRYDNHLLRVIIRDDGKGIAPKVLKEGGQPGHWGLPGVRERAKQIGARLDFWSESGRGTEVQLTVPVSIGSERPRDRSKFRLFRKTSES